MKFKDYYQILGVSEQASQDEIKRAYRKKARLYHPDVSKESNAEEKFKEINEAHEALRDEKKRAEYDQLKQYGYKQGDEFRGGPQWQNTGGFDPGSFGGGEFGDFFESIFGAGNTRRGGRQWPQQGDDIKLTLRVELENAYRGGKTKLQIPGADQRQISVNIPAGVTDGQLLRLRAQGRSGINGGPAGDLLLTIKLKPHRYFEVDGCNITLALPLTPYEAASGLKLQVPTLGGSVAMTIPAGTQSGTRLRLKGRGLPGSRQGDQFVVVQIQLPEQLSGEMLAQLQAFDEQSEHQPRAHFDGTVTN